MEEHRLPPSGWVVDIPRLGRDIEVTAQRQSSSWVTVMVQVAPEAAEPRKFVRKLLTAYHPPVGDVDTDYPYIFYLDGEEAGRRFFVTVIELADNVVRRRAREDGYSVVSPLPRDRHVIA
jgi:hypothetical protein